jgi:hypothetical protein
VQRCWERAQQQVTTASLKIAGKWGQQTVILVGVPPVMHHTTLWSCVGCWFKPTTPSTPWTTAANGHHSANPPTHACRPERSLAHVVVAAKPSPGTFHDHTDNCKHPRSDCSTLQTKPTNSETAEAAASAEADNTLGSRCAGSSEHACGTQLFGQDM